MAWTFDRYVLNTRLQLGHEEFMRSLPMGTNWQSLRIGVRFCVNDTARTTFVNTATQGQGFGLALGVCQGSSTSYFADTITDWVGAGYIGVTPGGGGYFSAQAAITLGTPNYWNFSGSRPNAARKTGASITFASESSVTSYITGSGGGGAFGGQFMSGLYVDIAKGSPNYSFTIHYSATAANAQANLTNAAFLANMETTGTPTNTSTLGAKTIAYSGAGLFDTVSVVNNRSWPHTEIDGIAVVRFT